MPYGDDRDAVLGSRGPRSTVEKEVGLRPVDTCGTQAVPSEQYEDKKRQLQLSLLEDIFKYHPPTPDQLPKYRAIRTAAKHFAEVVLDNTLDCRDQDTALHQIRLAVMIANASIALNGRF